MDILQATKAVFFLGTPHRGSHVLEKLFAQTGLKLGKMMLHKQMPAQIKTALQPRTSESFICNSDFVKIKGSIAIVNFYEQVNLPGLGELVVDKDSAVFDSEKAENIPIARDHRRLVRFTGPEDDAYRTLLETLKRKIRVFLLETDPAKSTDTLTQMSRDCIASLAVPLAWRRGKRPIEPHRATLRWFWEREGKFLKWLTRGAGLFSIEGKPGSGKTVLMGDMVSKARQFSEMDVLVHHFFNKRGQIIEHSFQGFLQSVLEQILRQQPSLFEHMLQDWYTMQDPQQMTPNHWPEWLLKRALTRVIALGSTTLRFLMIFDALDECQSEIDIVEILSFLKVLLDGTLGKNVRIVFSCRYLPDTSNLNPAECLRMEHHNQSDIANLVHDVWSSSIPMDAPADEFQELKKAIIKKANGIFLWVRLALDRVTKAVRDGGTSDEIRETIDELPGELSGIFEMLLGHPAQKHREETHAMLSMALTAKKPLTIEEFRLVLNLCSDDAISSLADMNRSTKLVSNYQVMQRRIRSRCGGLLEVVPADRLDTAEEVGETARNESRQVVQFVHQSVKDFLSLRSQDKTTGLPSPEQFEKDGHARLTRACLQYLRMSETYRLLRSSPNTTHYDLSLLAVRKNLVSLVEHLCKTGELVHETRFEADIVSHMSLAVTRGSHEAIKILLAYGADPNAPGELALPIACKTGNLDILRMLLDAGARFENESLLSGSKLRNRILRPSHNAIAMAAYSGDAEVVRLVLKLDPDALANPWNQHLAVMQLLAGAVNFQAEEANLMTITAKLQSRTSTLMSLLTTGSIDFGSVFGAEQGSAVMTMLCAVMGFSKEALDMLFEMNIALTPRALTFLLAMVASGGPLSAMQQLVCLGGASMVVECSSHDADNLLHLAAVNEDPTMAGYMLELGIDLNAQNTDGESPLHVAASFGTRAQVELLLDRGADTSLLTLRGRTVFHLALLNPKLRPCKALLARLFATDASQHIADRDGVLPIHLAAAQGWLATVEWLIEIGADIFSRDNQGRTPLHTAAASMGIDSTAVVRFLVDKGLEVEDADEGGMTPLHHVLYSYDVLHKDAFDPEVSLANARYLLQRGANVNAKDLEGTTPLHLAAWRGNSAVVKLLLKSGADVEARNRADVKPIDHAKEDEIWELLELAARI
ncbi:hypothetical protein D7B24_000653 [Verticillium nonalfalfae]|uniref:Peptidase A2 domain-containing protein n=1 Tax=Verticillium nonalfalfae TaxID=1051616 RepID=A0A3M9YJH5_9PEZI|nr:uncharacterized protein D7B24_000653 [Verticillium nonalfalfae]RNJ59936.1 hypothetical protein D7B24_000653 [Verticillium nonalfalfae]